MPPKKSAKTKSSLSRPHRTLIAEADQRRINEIQLLETESNSLSARLRNLSQLEQELEYSGEDAKSYIQELRKRRRNVTEELRKASKDARFFANLNLIKDQFNLTLVRVQDIFGPWSVLNLPVMSEGISETPGTTGTEGEIVTAGLFQGSGAFGGMPSNSSSRERFWIHNWKCVAVLPPAPQAGSVSFRFGGNIEAFVYHVEGTGTLRAFVTIGTTSDVNKPITNWQGVGFPIDVTLPQPSQGSFSGGVPVVGSIAVNQGQSAAVGIIFGVVISVIDGYVMLLGNSNFLAGLLGGTDSTAVGKVEYRFNPQLVIGLVQQAMALAL
jgi:hypothetical protein